MKDKNTRPEAYPKPTQTDQQHSHQSEFIDQKPNEFDEKSVSDLPPDKSERQSNDPIKDSERGGE